MEETELAYFRDQLILWLRDLKHSASMTVDELFEAEAFMADYKDFLN